MRASHCARAGCASRRFRCMGRQLLSTWRQPPRVECRGFDGEDHADARKVSRRPKAVARRAVPGRRADRDDSCAILMEDGFEQVDMVEPRKALDQAGAETHIVSPRDKRVRAWNLTNWGDQFPVDVALDQAKPQEFDALLLPGGVMNPTSFGRSRSRVCEGFLRRRQAGGGDLPRPMDGHRDWRGAR